MSKSLAIVTDAKQGRQANERSDSPTNRRDTRFCTVSLPPKPGIRFAISACTLNHRSVRCGLLASTNVHANIDPTLHDLEFSCRRHVIFGNPCQSLGHAVHFSCVRSPDTVSRDDYQNSKLRNEEHNNQPRAALASKSRRIRQRGSFCSSRFRNARSSGLNCSCDVEQNSVRHA